MPPSLDAAQWVRCGPCPSYVVKPSVRQCRTDSDAASPSRRLLDGAGEGVAGRRRPVFIPAREPAAALFGRAVRPRFRVHLALRLLLDAVVADRSGGVEAVVDVGLREFLDETGVDRVCGPDAGVAVGL